MIKPLLKTAMIVVSLALLPIESVNAQLRMTHLPSRIEEVLINPDLKAVLRNNVSVRTETRPTAAVAVAAPRVASRPQSPIYSNEPTRFSAIQPRVDSTKSAPNRLPTIEATEKPPRIVRRPADVTLSEEVTDAPPERTSQPPRPAALPKNDRVAPDFGGNTDMLKPVAPIKGQLRFRVTGVTAMVEGQPADLLIEVYNPTGHAIGPVEVNVQVPEELTITRFDRDAWLDAERRIIAFQLDRVDAQVVEKIGMKGVSNTAGRTSLNVALVSGNTTIAQSSIATQVFPQQFARKQTFGDSAPTNTIRK